MNLAAAVSMALFGVVFGVLAQQPPPPVVPAVPQPPRDVTRRPPPELTGTGVIRGRVVTADTGSPLRRAAVNLSPVSPAVPPAPQGPAGGRGGTSMTMIPPTLRSNMPVQGSVSAAIARPRQAMTDAQGAFEFSGLPPGSYRISATANQYAPQYLGMAYGGKKPNGPGSSDPGQPIQLTDGQSFDKAIIALPRGAVITGRVTDENGIPLARVQVYTLFFPAGNSRGMRMGSGNQTDDLGQFRVYGLQPGEHGIVAEAMRFNFSPPNGQPETEEDKIGFVTTYYPGTADEGAAQRVRTQVGAETSGIEIQLLQGRLYRISGSVVDSRGQPLPRINGQVMRRTSGMTGSSSFGFSTDESGQFQMRNVPSGNYRVIIQRTRPSTPGPQTEPGEMASVPLTIAGADVENVLVMTGPGTTITGQVVLEQGEPSSSAGPIRVMAQFGNPDEMSGLQSPQPAVAKPDLTFTMKGMLGEFVLRATGPNQYLKSVTVGTEDVTDSPREFKANDRVTITLTTRASTLEGTVIDATGAPASDASIIVFSEDKATWRFNSTRTRRSTVDPSGHFRVTGLMPGRYFVAAISRDRLNMPMTGSSAIFEEVSKEATALVLGEDDQRRVDLKFVPQSGGR